MRESVGIAAGHVNGGEEEVMHGKMNRDVISRATGTSGGEGRGSLRARCSERGCVYAYMRTSRGDVTSRKRDLCEAKERDRALFSTVSRCLPTTFIL